MALWTPAEITTALWFDASDTSTITHVANEVSQWDDKSGNARHLTQATAANKFTTNTDTVNGLNALYMDGTDYMDTPNFAYGSAVGIFGVLKPTLWQPTHASYPYFYRTGDYSATVGISWQFANATGGDWVDNDCLALCSGDNAGQAPRAIGPVVDGSDARVFSVVAGNNETDAFLNGTSFATRVKSNGPTDNGTTYLRLGDPTRSPIGDICEFIWIASEVATTTRQKIEGYLAWKWGLEAQLPSGHPYENAAPTLGGPSRGFCKMDNQFGGDATTRLGGLLE